MYRPPREGVTPPFLPAELPCREVVTAVCTCHAIRVLAELSCWEVVVLPFTGRVASDNFPAGSYKFNHQAIQDESREGIRCQIRRRGMCEGDNSAGPREGDNFPAGQAREDVRFFSDGRANP